MSREKCFMEVFGSFTWAKNQDRVTEFHSTKSSNYNWNAKASQRFPPHFPCTTNRKTLAKYVVTATLRRKWNMPIHSTGEMRSIKINNDKPHRCTRKTNKIMYLLVVPSRLSNCQTWRRWRAKRMTTKMWHRNPLQLLILSKRKTNLIHCLFIHLNVNYDEEKTTFEPEPETECCGARDEKEKHIFNIRM